MAANGTLRLARTNPPTAAKMRTSHVIPAHLPLFGGICLSSNKYMNPIMPTVGSTHTPMMHEKSDK